MPYVAVIDPVPVGWPLTAQVANDKLSLRYGKSDGSEWLVLVSRSPVAFAAEGSAQSDDEQDIAFLGGTMRLRSSTANTQNGEAPLVTGDYSDTSVAVQVVSLGLPVDVVVSLLRGVRLIGSAEWPALVESWGITNPC